MPSVQQWEQGLRACLLHIEENDADYASRYRLVFEAIALALRAGIHAGIGLDPEEPDWPVAFIELPTGQVTWHFPSHPIAWDGHDTDEKYRRIREYCVGAPR